MTVQGEIIEQQFGEKEVCFRTLDLYTRCVRSITEWDYGHVDYGVRSQIGITECDRGM